MKKIVSFLFLSMILFSIQARDIDESAVPASVKAYVSKNYTNIQNVEWEYKKRNNYYKVEFDVDSREVKLEISPSGKLLYSKEDIDKNKIPDFVKSYIKKNYTDPEILSARKRMEDGEISYNVRISFRNSSGYLWHRNIVLDEKGNVLRN